MSLVHPQVTRALGCLGRLGRLGRLITSGQDSVPDVSCAHLYIFPDTKGAAHRSGSNVFMSFIFSLFPRVTFSCALNLLQDRRLAEIALGHHDQVAQVSP